jgi:tetratricopeptide (TPR) repeat protein
LLETLRQFGADRLGDAGETEATRARHGEHFVARAQQWHRVLDSPAYDDAAAAVRVDFDNLRATVKWCAQGARWDTLGGLCRNVWYFLTQWAPVEGIAWYRQFLDHADALDGQMVVDALGELAFLEVYNVADYDAAARSTRRSLELSDAHELLPSSAAWMSAALAASFREDHEQALTASARALVVAEERDDENIAISALLVQPSAWMQAGEPERAVEIVQEVLPRARRFGHPTLIAAAVIVTAGFYAWSLPHPDFAAALAILEREHLGDAGGEAGAMWLDLIAAFAHLGLGHPDAFGHFVAAARVADRLNAPHALDRALSGVALCAAEAGFSDQARALVAYTSDALAGHRAAGDFGQQWIEARLQAVLGEEIRTTDAVLRRSEVIAILDQLEEELVSLRSPA